MSDDKVSVKEALDKLYDLSWMIGSTATEYLTDKDGEKIRDYIGVIEDRLMIWRRNCPNLKSILNHTILMRRLLKLLLDQSAPI